MLCSDSWILASRMARLSTNDARKVENGFGNGFEDNFQ